MYKYVLSKYGWWWLKLGWYNNKTDIIIIYLLLFENSLSFKHLAVL